MTRLVLISLAGINATAYLHTHSPLNLGTAALFAVLAGMACPKLLKVI